MYLQLKTVVIVMLQDLLNTLFGEQTSSVPSYTLRKGYSSKQVFRPHKQDWSISLSGQSST